MDGPIADWHLKQIYDRLIEFEPSAYISPDRRELLRSLAKQILPELVLDNLREPMGQSVVDIAVCFILSHPPFTTDES